MRRLKYSFLRLRRNLHNNVVEGNWHQTFLPILNVAITLLLFAAFMVVLYDFGFKPFWSAAPLVDFWLNIALHVLTVLITIRLVVELFIPKKRWTRILNLVSWFFIIGLTFFVLPLKSGFTTFTSNEFVFMKLLLYGSIAAGFITESSYFIQNIYSRSVNPGVLFVGSFAFLILSGVFLLKLPNATYNGISVLDALFTATSAVCVTGLIVVDTATAFTTFGHMIIILLIQVGGLGIMTFAGLLAYAVAGKSSLKSQLALRDMLSNRQVNNVMRFVYQVVGLTLMFELAGAAGIFFSLDDSLFDRKLDRIFFSIFHSVSAFCNAGFSTYSGGLYEPVIRFNYSMQLVIALLVITGGMGFPIVFNLYRFLNIRYANTMRMVQGNNKREYFPKVININSRLALIMSGSLLLIGFVVYFLFEQRATLAQHPTFWGKIVTSFFGSVTPRTAGFNTVDMAALSLPTIMVYLLLMWIGTSPGSTGGGIRTTTAGLALLNMMAVIRGKDRTEFFRTEVSHQSVRRAFAIVILSLLLIGIAILLISFSDGEKGLVRIAFEVFSAFSTVGLSLGVTPEMSPMSKMVLISTMFIGRVGMLTLLVAFVRQSKTLYYRYPKEEIVF
jgi:potassium uptake TrkH family protein